jgi:hypothetical protein
MAIGSAPFLLPLLFQECFGLNAFSSGMLVLSVFAGNLAMKPATTAVLRRFGFRTVLIVNGLLAAASILACAWLAPATPRAVIVAVLFCGGLFRSMHFTALNSVGFADVAPAQMAGANTFFSTANQMTMGMGIALGAIALQAAALLHSNRVAHMTLSDYQLAFVLVSIVGAAAVADCFALDRNAGAIVSGHRV